MPRLRIAIFAIAVAAGFAAPAAAQATVTATNITSWTSNGPGTPPNSRYLISYDNQPTTLAVTGTAPGAAATDHVDIVCYFGLPSQAKVLVSNLSVSAQQTFATLTGASAPQLRLIAGQACRLRAIPHNGEANGDASQFAGPQVAVSETALLPTISGGMNNGKAYNYYVNGTTFTGFAAWKAAGTPATNTTGACGGPYAAPVDQALDIGNFPIDCVGSLLANDLNVWGGRSEVQIDGRDAYDAASAQALFPRTSGDNGSQDLAGFPSLSTSVNWDPRNGLVSSQAQESWVACHGPEVYPATAANCLSFDDAGVRLTRDVTTSDGGQVITQTDTWS